MPTACRSASRLPAGEDDGAVRRLPKSRRGSSTLPRQPTSSPPTAAHRRAGGRVPAAARRPAPVPSCAAWASPGTAPRPIVLLRPQRREPARRHSASGSPPPTTTRSCSIPSCCAAASRAAGSNSAGCGSTCCWRPTWWTPTPRRKPLTIWPSGAWVRRWRRQWSTPRHRTRSRRSHPKRSRSLLAVRADACLRLAPGLEHDLDANDLTHILRAMSRCRWPPCWPTSRAGAWPSTSTRCGSFRRPCRAKIETLAAAIHADAGETLQHQLAQATRPRALRETGAAGGPQDQVRLLHRQRRARRTGRRVPRGAAGAGLPGHLQAQVNLCRRPRQPCGSRKLDASTPASTRRWPPRGGCRRPTRICRTSPSAPHAVARSGGRSSRAPTILPCWPSTTRKSSSGCWPTRARTRPCARRFRKDRTFTPQPPRASTA